MKKICIVIPYSYPVPAVKGGAVETLVQFLVEENEKKQHFRFTVITTYDQDASDAVHEYKCSEFLFLKKVKYIDALLEFVFRLLKKIFHIYIPCSIRFCKILKHIKNHGEEYDFVLFESGLSYMLPLLAKIYPKEKIINHMHWSGDGNKKMDQSFGLLMPVSEFIGKVWRNATGRKADKIKVLHNCVKYELFDKQCTESESNDLKRELGIPLNSKVIVFTGRIIPEKGVKELIQAFTDLKMENTTLLIIGSATFGVESKTVFEREIEKMVKRCNKKIVFTGFIKQKDLYRYYSLADIAIAPSTCPEAAPLVGIEFQAAGLPMIATNVGGIPEYVVPESCVLIDYDENIVENLTLSMEELLNHPEKLKEMGQLAKMHAKKYDTAAFYDEFVKIISEL